MEFLKRHFEKLILALVLVIFIIALLYLVEVARTVDEGAEVTIRPAQVDYPKVDQKAPEVDVKYQFENGMTWAAAAARTEVNKEHFSDLVDVFKAARCPHCNKIIPLYYFHEARGCPLCGKELKTPPERVVVQLDLGSQDWDSDGIPNAIEEKLGLDPKDPTDALLDKDRDGFSNLYEHKMGTLLDDPKSHPPMWHRLYVKDLKRVVLPIRLMAVNSNSSSNKDDWVVQISSFDLRTNTKGRDLGMFSIGQELTLDRRQYILTDIDLRQRAVKEGNTETVVDESIIKIKQKNGPIEVSMQVGKEVYSPTLKAIIADCGDIAENPTGREYTLDVGDSFLIGNRQTGGEIYRVREINEETKEVSLLYRQNNRPVPEKITRDGVIPVDQRVKPSTLRGVIPGGRLEAPTP